MSYRTEPSRRCKGPPLDNLESPTTRPQGLAVFVVLPGVIWEARKNGVPGIRGER